MESFLDEFWSSIEVGAYTDALPDDIPGFDENVEVEKNDLVRQNFLLFMCVLCRPS